MTKPAILVTGGAGYIGSHAVLALLDAGYPVVVIDNLVTGFRWAVDARAKFVRGSVDDEALVQQVLHDDGIAAIMHFAGSVVVPESVQNPLKYYRNNTAASCSLIQSAVRCGVRHFIFSSTAATYGMPERLPVTENSPTVPINPYGRSKLMTEQMLADVALTNALNFCVLRYFNVAGADPKGRVGQSTAGATHLLKVALEAATGKRDHVAIYGDDFPTSDGTGVRDYIHVSDLAAAHVHALEALLTDPAKSYTLNCGYGRGFSVMDVLDAVDRITNTPLQRRIEPRRPGDPPEIIADNSAILAALPWRPMNDSLDQIVADALAWERNLQARQLSGDTEAANLLTADHD